jgi:DNA-binding PadR family transcriptional regulator
MNEAELAILSIIAEAPITGYDLQTVIDQRNLRAWTSIGVESIYYLIDKLEKQGLIEGVKKLTESTRQQYRITSAGVGILQTAVVDMLSSPRAASSGFEIGLANLHVLKTSQVRHALQGYRGGLQIRLETINQRLRNLLEKTTPPFHIISMFEHQISLLKAELLWFDKWIATWEEQAPPDHEEKPVPSSGYTVPRMQQLILPNDPDSFHKQKTVRRGEARDAIAQAKKQSDPDPNATPISKKTEILPPAQKKPPDPES